MNQQDPAQRNPGEEFWAQHYAWLTENGYILRPRFHPGWVPSWEGTNHDPTSCEDGVVTEMYRTYFMMDAKRIADGKLVMLKKVMLSERDEGTDEVELLDWLSEPELRSQEKNRCVPLLDVLEVPDSDMVIMVMPFLRPFDSPSFNTVGEALHFIQQALEAVHFLHSHFVTHRDCTGINFMMDAEAMYPKGFHPILQDLKPNIKGKAKHYSRTEVNLKPKYYLTNFRLAQRMNPSTTKHLIEPAFGTDRSPPEFQGQRAHQLHDPFATDIYYLGNMINNEFVISKKGCEDFLGFAKSMMDPNPARRPLIQDAIKEFTRISNKLPFSKLKQRLVPRRELEITRWMNDISHFFRKVKYSVKGLNPDLGGMYPVSLFQIKSQ
ncbi:hypothetical protein M422DRAFT_156137 [Sphaerobolus stellatus SS14]|nr:hypothetical protein M422DRAFT_156137 [Sphaerobolus stellatus SS14]